MSDAIKKIIEHANYFRELIEVGTQPRIPPNAVKAARIVLEEGAGATGLTRENAQQLRLALLALAASDLSKLEGIIISTSFSGDDGVPIMIAGSPLTIISLSVLVRQAIAKSFRDDGTIEELIERVKAIESVGAETVDDLIKKIFSAERSSVPEPTQHSHQPKKEI